ncbi:MAG: hypothetical protein HYT11_02625, partial [Candidatus Levybacteria bacterium]|nr:hypothetical protein [Candidatus Levybacteria bacterium]
MKRVVMIAIPIVVGFVFTFFFLWQNITVPAVYITPTVGTNDLTDALVPLRFINKQFLQRGELPLWLSQFSSGYPYYAWVMAIFYPVNLISYLFPLIQGLNFVLFADLFLVFLFSYLYLRKIRIGIYASLFSASLISFGGFSANELIRSDILVTFYLFIAQLWLLEMLIQRQNVISSPSVILSEAKDLRVNSARDPAKPSLTWRSADARFLSPRSGARNDKKRIFVPDVALVLVMGMLWGFSVSAGHPQILFYSMLMLFPYWLLFWLRQKRSILLFIIHYSLFIVVGLGVGAGYILPMAEFTLNSDRASGLSVESVSRYNFPFEAIVTLIKPFALFDDRHTVDAWTKNAWPTDERYVYMGVLGLVFGVIGAIRVIGGIRERRYGAHGMFFLITAVIALLFAFGTQLTVGNILTIPPFSFFRIPFKIIFLINFSLGVLAAFSFDDFYVWLRKHFIDSALVGKRLIVRQRATQIMFRKAFVVGIIAILFVVSFFDLKINADKLHPPVAAKTWYQTPEAVKFFKGKLHDQERVTTQFYYYPSIKIFLLKSELWDNPEIFVNLRNLLPAFNNLLYPVPMNVGAANSAAIKVNRYNKLEQEIFFGGIRYAADLSAIEVSESFMFLNRIMGVKYAIFGWPVQNEILLKAKEIKFKNGQDPIYIYEFFDYFPR